MASYYYLIVMWGKVQWTLADCDLIPDPALRKAMILVYTMHTDLSRYSEILDLFDTDNTSLSYALNTLMAQGEL
jgi:hypothetical protein